MLHELKIANYGPVVQATIELTPLHALIGPNDSGKSTVLRALRTLTLLAANARDTLTRPEGHALREALFSNAQRGEVSLAVSGRSKPSNPNVARAGGVLGRRGVTGAGV